MRIFSMSESAKIRLHHFCIRAAINHSYECVTASYIDLFDFWIDDENEKLLFVVQPKNVYFYSPVESLIISREEFQEIQII